MVAISLDVSLLQCGSTPEKYHAMCIEKLDKHDTSSKKKKEHDTVYKPKT